MIADPLSIISIIWLYLITGYVFRCDLLICRLAIEDWWDDVLIVIGWPVLLLVVLIMRIRGR